MGTLRKLLQAFGWRLEAHSQQNAMEPDKPEAHHHSFQGRIDATGRFTRVCSCGVTASLEESQRLDAEENARFDALGNQLLEKYADLINKFLDIAERKVSVLDDYGDEHMHLLPIEIDACIAKIAGREGMDESFIKRGLRSERESGEQIYVLNGKLFLITEALRRVRLRLPELFAEYHRQQKSRSTPQGELSSLSGVEFETYVARILRAARFDVTGTPMTGDQGADLIAKKGTRTIVIQAKRFRGSVGNHAVQEVVGAVKFYGGTEGLVVTNSTFTRSARALAQKNDIRLIDGAQLEQLREL